MKTLFTIREILHTIGHTQYFEQIDEETTIGKGEVQLQLDSLEMLEFSIDIEEETGIYIPVEKLNEFKTVGDIINFIEEEKAR